MTEKKPAGSRTRTAARTKPVPPGPPAAPAKARPAREASSKPTTTLARRPSAGKAAAASSGREGPDRANSSDLDAEQALGFLMWDTTRGFLRHFSRRISQHGVNFGQWPFLRVLWAEDGITQAQLAARVRMRSPTTVAAVDWLERNGFVRRRAHPEDLRKINVFLTAKGRRIYPKVAPEIRYVNERAAKGLSARELAQLKALLGRLRSNLDEPPELPRRR